MEPAHIPRLSIKRRTLTQNTPLKASFSQFPSNCWPQLMHLPPINSSHVNLCRQITYPLPFFVLLTLTRRWLWTLGTFRPASQLNSRRGRHNKSFAPYPLKARRSPNRLLHPPTTIPCFTLQWFQSTWNHIPFNTIDSQNGCLREQRALSLDEGVYCWQTWIPCLEKISNSKEFGESCEALPPNLPPNNLVRQKIHSVRKLFLRVHIADIWTFDPRKLPEERRDLGKNLHRYL